MTRERLAMDGETWPIRPGRQFPRVVCLQTRFRGVDRLWSREEGLDFLEHALEHTDCLFVGHFVTYDVLCSIASRPRLARLWLQAYKADRVTCTGEREKLIRCAQGTLDYFPRNTLEDLLSRYKLPNPYAEGAKTSKVRTTYHTLEGLPVSEYPAEYRDYALADLCVDSVYQAQQAYALEHGGGTLEAPHWLADEYNEARASLWLSATSAHGMRVDPEAVHVLSALIEQEHQEVRELLTYLDPDAIRRYAERKGIEPLPVSSGPLVRAIGTKNMKAARDRMIAVRRHLGLPITLTKTGKQKQADGETINPEDYVSLDVDACAEVLDPVLIAYARFGSISTLRGRAERLRMAGELGLPIQPRFDTLKQTGRTSSSTGGKVKAGAEIKAFGDQTQNLPREPGLRECYVARTGCLILSSDWKAAELHALAQSTIDLGLDSQMARVLNGGTDIHIWFACLMKGWGYEWATSKDRTAAEKKEIKNARQAAKACNFGFPGGLGIEKFRLFAAKQYGVRMTEEQARALKGLWLEAFPEMRGYFAHITRLIDSGEPLIHFGSKRYRGRLRYTAAANSYFQGRVADMLKDAGFRILDRIWSGALTARIWNEAHDEILVEFPETDTSVPGVVVSIMEEVGRIWCPACPPSAEPALQRHWRKGAEPAYRGGVLIPWEDREISSLSEKDQKVLDSDLDPIQKSWALGVEVDRLSRLAKGDRA